MNRFIEAVTEFHNTFGIAGVSRMDMSNHSLNTLRLNLISEEVSELMDEVGEGFQHEDHFEFQPKVEPISRERVAKELADLLYVVIGTAVSWDVPLEEVFEEVHRSNMSKAGPDGKPIFRDDGKLLKGPDYTPAELKPIIEAHLNQPEN